AGGAAVRRRVPRATRAGALGPRDRTSCCRAVRTAATARDPRYHAAPGHTPGGRARPAAVRPDTRRRLAAAGYGCRRTRNVAGGRLAARPRIRRRHRRRDPAAPRLRLAADHGDAT